MKLFDRNRIGDYGWEFQIYISFGIQYISGFCFSYMDLEVATNIKVISFLCLLQGL